MNQKTRSYVVIGLGSFGSTVASELAQFGNHVMGIGLNERNVSALADTLAEAIIADARDEDALREAGVGKYDVAVVAIGEDLESNILCTMNLKKLGVPTIWAKATSATHKLILSKLGVDRIIQPETEMGLHVANLLHNPQVFDYVSLDHGNFLLYYRLPAKLHGQNIRTLDLDGRFELRCLGLMRSGAYVACESGDTGLCAEDKLILLGSGENLRTFSASL
jgi:trk system potassium uptake protein